MPSHENIYSVVFQYVVVPTRRATAEALQIMVCHLLGDAGSPYLLGAVRPVITVVFLHLACLSIMKTVLKMDDKMCSYMLFQVIVAFTYANKIQ